MPEVSQMLRAGRRTCTVCSQSSLYAMMPPSHSRRKAGSYHWADLFCQYFISLQNIRDIPHLEAQLLLSLSINSRPVYLMPFFQFYWFEPKPCLFHNRHIFDITLDFRTELWIKKVSGYCWHQEIQACCAPLPSGSCRQGQYFYWRLVLQVST